MMKRGRRDNNQATLVRLLRQLGCTVFDLANVGQGCPDLLVGYQGFTHLVEVKDDRGAYGRRGLSKTQSNFARTWNGAPVCIIKNEEEAEEWVQGMSDAR